MGIIADMKSIFSIGKNPEQKASINNDLAIADPGGKQFQGSILKGFMPEFLYKPPYGFPRNQDVTLLRKLEKNAYIHSIISTIQFQISATAWDLEWQDGDSEEDEALKQQIMNWFDNPNGNAESFSDLLRMVVRDILVLDSGIWVKVFDAQKNFKQVFCRDGSTFLKNPDPHGYLGNRDEFIDTYKLIYDKVSQSYQSVPVYNQLSDLVTTNARAAYYQYGWTRANVPVPFGLREIIWFSQNPLSNNVYGRSPLEVLGNALLTLIYGGAYNMDMYLNSNMPDGILSVLGAHQNDINAIRDRLLDKFTETDDLDNVRKVFHKIPIVNTPVEFKPFNLSSKDMEVITQQQWFWKIVLAAFNITPSEMGFTEDSNKATEVVQSSVFKRKAIGPLLDMIEYKINMQLMPELDPEGKFRFKFDDYDIQADKAKHELYQMQINMGIKTPEMVAKEEGINVKELNAQKDEASQRRINEQSKLVQPQGMVNKEQQAFKENAKAEKETKSAPEQGLNDYLDAVEKAALKMADDMTFDLNKGPLGEIG